MLLGFPDVTIPTYITIQIEEKTRMTTSISSKAFCIITNRQTDKTFTELMPLDKGHKHNKIGERSQLGAQKITIPPKRC